MILTLRWFKSCFEGLEEELLIHKVSLFCAYAQRPACELALGAEHNLDCPVWKQAASKSVLHGTV